MDRIVVGTRGSLLARWQAGFVARTLRVAHPGLEIEEKIIVTEGDRLSAGSSGKEAWVGSSNPARLGDAGRSPPSADAALWNAGGKAVWVKEIEVALLAGEVDVAVHSMKDVPGELAPGLTLVAIPERADARDAVVSREGSGLVGLPTSARVGTASLRRACQLKALRPDFQVEILRGNLDTRLRKVADGAVDAAILACAGLDRLGFAGRISERLPIERMLPAVGQGALAVEIRADDQRTRAFCQALDHRETAVAVLAERSFLARLGATCRTPVAGHAWLCGEDLVLRGLVGRPDGTQVLADQAFGRVADAEEVGRGLAETLLCRGAGSILAECG